MVPDPPVLVSIRRTQDMSVRASIGNRGSVSPTKQRADSPCLNPFHIFLSMHLPLLVQL